MQRRHGGVLTVLAALTAVLAVIAAPSPVLATPHHDQQPRGSSGRDFFYSGHAGGSLVQALGTTVHSDLTGASGVEGVGRASDTTPWPASTSAAAW